MLIHYRLELGRRLPGDSSALS